MKYLIVLIFIVLYLLVTIFGLGPVLMADGTMAERLITFGLVVFVYGIITFFLFRWRRFLKNK